MTDPAENAALNSLLIDLGRKSLLQHMAVTAPWTKSAADERRDQLDELIERQAVLVDRMAEFLNAREWPVDFGVYPDMSDLNFLALDFLLPRVAADADAVLAEAEATRDRLHDPEAAELLDAVAGEQRHIAAALRDMCR